MAEFELELGQDGVAERFGSDPGAIGNEKDGTVWHEQSVARRRAQVPP